MKIWIKIVAIVGICSSMLGQVSEQIQKYRNDEYGNIANRKETILNGNRIRSLIYNNGEIGQWPFQPSGEWPSGSGQGYIDGITPIIAAEVIAPGSNTIIHPLETSYREWMDKNPVTGEIWGLEPLPGYSHPNSFDFAISSNQKSWPEAWPDALPRIDETWNGQWYGYFGKGKLNADYESFFVMDDSRDHEFTRAPYNYYPLASDQNRGGLGLRIEVRTLNWSNKDVKDISFWHYEIFNLSDQTYEKTISGFYVDSGVGGTNDSGDDMAGFDKYHDIVYQFDNDGLGFPNSWPTGYMGIAFLETASNNFNGIDDDEDGLIDESRSDGIDNDGDWKAYSDLNMNKLWDLGEPLNDDLGADGIGPGNENYTISDNGEGDGIPTDGEPNFDKTDVSESDMIGLTSLSIYRMGDGGSGGGWPKDDETMWE